MLFLILLSFCLFTYYVSRGCIEGYVWATHKQRLSNKAINPGGKYRKESNGIFDYHTWRLIEQISVIGALFALYFATPVIFIVAFLYCLIGISFGWTLYEILLNYVDDGIIEKDKVFTIGKYSIPVSHRIKYLGFVLGIVSTIVLFFI